ncbi:LamB/YcsF family protein [Pradoshia sp. D12]|uniref:LamB/YcsF family protein n=1 Tax=Bacillaceae TaxID=186817 RepID=UPI00080AC42F|nr:MULTISPECIES: 5-oxoprolinase subunit PxpA [Bacillaceae]OCA89456.1 lactam utilization protein LamB [Bacillus sp. FJAT-27986]QFK71162.1 LamB/YcsF family protein [Pradoshia sp. D12]TPF72955.1 LamB/YcsF family protein [Bacillus sp. D12]
MYKIDINCDMGESFGQYRLGRDEEILNYVSSANIACGFHAGDPSTMKKTVRLALSKGVGIGAHPGFQDLIGFGRREMRVSPEEAYDLVIYQIGALYAFTKAEGGKLQHVKPHGALFNMAAKDVALSEAISEAVYDVDPELILFGLSGGELVKAAKRIGLRAASEVFSDRTYQADGTLTSRTEANALIKDPTKAIHQVVRMVKEQRVTSVQDEVITIKADTVCIHGDGENALEFAKQISETLKREDIEIQKIDRFINELI